MIKESEQIQFIRSTKTYPTDMLKLYFDLHDGTTGHFITKHSKKIHYFQSEKIFFFSRFSSTRLTTWANINSSSDSESSWTPTTNWTMINNRKRLQPVEKIAMIYEWIKVLTKLIFLTQILVVFKWRSWCFTWYIQLSTKLKFAILISIAACN